MRMMSDVTVTRRTPFGLAVHREQFDEDVRDAVDRSIDRRGRLRSRGWTFEHEESEAEILT